MSTINEHWTAGQKEMHEILSDAAQRVGALEKQLEQLPDRQQPHLSLTPGWLGGPRNQDRSNAYNKDVIEKEITRINSDAGKRVGELLNKMSPSERDTALQQIALRQQPKEIERLQKRDILESMELADKKLAAARSARIQEDIPLIRPEIDQQTPAQGGCKENKDQEKEQRTDAGVVPSISEKFVQSLGYSRTLDEKFKEPISPDHTIKRDINSPSMSMQFSMSLGYTGWGGSGDGGGQNAMSDRDKEQELDRE